jgi:undecaprenyl-diphosphatase
MTIIQGILLGILQGITEFLPVSSSGHLAVAQHLFGLGEVPTLFDIFLHLATLAAVILYFRKTIGRLFCILGRWIARRPEPETSAQNGRGITKNLAGNDSVGHRTILMVILTTIITGAIGVAFEKVLPKLFGVESFAALPVKFICMGFIITAVLLIVSSIVQKKSESKKQSAESVEKINNSSSADSKPKGLSVVQSLVIGLAQGIGTLPGISRSGSTIAGALFSGVDRVTAGDYSFIVSIPAIIGAFILELKDIGSVVGTIGPEPVIAGCAAAFASGYIALTWLMRVIHKGRLEWFAAYLIPLGILGLIFF